MAKREQKVQMLRILKIDSMIRDGNFPSTEKMIKKFEVSRPTIMRDIEFLRDRYNAPLEYDTTRKGYYYTDPSFFIKSVMLTEGELLSIAVMQPLLEQYRNTPLEKSIKNIFKKIMDILPNEISVDSFFMQEGLSFISDPLPKIDAKVFATVFKSLREKRTIEFTYESLYKLASHKVQPYHIVCQKGSWYVLCFNSKYNDITTYSLSRIKEIKLTKEKFEIPATFNPHDYFDSEFGVWHMEQKPVKIELLFSKEIRTIILERKWHSTQKIKENKDGSVYLSFVSNQLHDILHMVLSYGSNVQVLSPKELKDSVLAEAKKNCGYGEGLKYFSTVSFYDTPHRIQCGEYDNFLS